MESDRDRPTSTSPPGAPAPRRGSRGSTLLLALAAIAAGLVTRAILSGTGLPSKAERVASIGRDGVGLVEGEPLAHYVAARTAAFLASATFTFDAPGTPSDVRWRGLGTAAAVASDGYWLTAAHSIGADPPTLLVPDSDGSVTPAIASLVWRDDALDLALLRVEASHLAFALSAQPSPAVGSRLVAAGFGEGASGFGDGAPVPGALLIGGQVLEPAPARSGRAGEVAVTTLPIVPGDSGGPVVTPAGALVGIAVAKGRIVVLDLERLAALIAADRATRPRGP